MIVINTKRSAPLSPRASHKESFNNWFHPKFRKKREKKMSAPYPTSSSSGTNRNKLSLKQFRTEFLRTESIWFASNGGWKLQSSASECSSSSEFTFFAISTSWSSTNEFWISFLSSKSTTKSSSISSARRSASLSAASGKVQFLNFEQFSDFSQNFQKIFRKFFTLNFSFEF